MWTVSVFAELCNVQSIRGMCYLLHLITTAGVPARQNEVIYDCCPGPARYTIANLPTYQPTAHLIILNYFNAGSDSVSGSLQNPTSILLLSSRYAGEHFTIFITWLCLVSSYPRWRCWTSRCRRTRERNSRLVCTTNSYSYEKIDVLLLCWLCVKVWLSCSPWQSSSTRSRWSSPSPPPVPS